jgi:tripartite-type tricarboxylate transporter receptor subunit TctC
MTARSNAIVIAITVWAAVLAMPGFAQSYPARTVRMVVGFPPGGMTDVFARQIAERVAADLGQQVVVENRPGASATIGADVVAKARPDGYTLLMGHNNSNAIAPLLFPNLPYDAAKDFAPIALVGWGATVLVIHPAVPARNIAEFTAVARRSNGQLRVASSGVGSTQHLALERFMLATGTRMVHVPYKGSGQAVIDLIGGQVDANFDGIGTVLTHIRSGKLRALGVGLLQRAPQLPDVPTIDEQGLKGFESGSWFGLFAPAGTPRNVIDRWSALVRQLQSQRDFAERIEALGGQIAQPNTPEEFATFVTLDTGRWAAIIKAANIRID